MKISNIAPKITSGLKNATLNLGKNVQNKGSFASKLNKFTEGRGINPGRGAFLALIFSCTLIPRFLKARDDDERSEILRRDVTTILTITFAMKAIKAGACGLMAKKSGLPLTYTNIPKSANKLKKALGFFQQKGTTAFDADQIAANYSNINGKSEFTRFLKFIDENDGNVGKVLTFDKAKPKSPFKNKQTDGVLTAAAKKLLGEDFDFSRPNKEIIEEIRNKDTDHKGFKAIAKALNNGEDNPIAKFAKGIGAKFETASLAIVVAFLGFGLPKLNEKMTKDKYFNNNGALKTSYEDPNSKVPRREVINTMNTNQRMVFQPFLGAYKAAENVSGVQNSSENLNNLKNTLNARV